MAKILYIMCGEGRGHATRVQTIVDRMKHEHFFILLAARDAYDKLVDRYADDPKVVVRHRLRTGVATGRSQMQVALDIPRPSTFSLGRRL